MKRIVFAAFLVIGFAGACTAQWRYRVSTTPASTVVRTPCEEGNCPTAQDKKVQDAPVIAEALPLKPIDPMKIESELRGDAAVSTSPLVRATPEAMVAEAVSLPESDAEMFYCTLYHKAGDPLAKSLLEEWKTSETLRSLSDPHSPQMDGTRCKFMTVDVDDVTQADLVKSVGIETTPCVVVQSARVECRNVPANVVLCRVEGYDGDIERYSRSLIRAFNAGIDRAIMGRIAPVTAQAGRYVPNIPASKRLEDANVSTIGALPVDVKIRVPEDTVGVVDGWLDKVLGSVASLKTVLLVIAFLVAAYWGRDVITWIAGKFSAWRMGQDTEKNNIINDRLDALTALLLEQAKERKKNDVD